MNNNKKQEINNIQLSIDIDNEIVNDECCNCYISLLYSTEQDSNSRVGSSYCTTFLILGLPIMITKLELDVFLEPFSESISNILLLKELKKAMIYNNSININNDGSCCNAKIDIVDDVRSNIQYQYKVMALVSFYDSNNVEAFFNLYNNVQFPSLSEISPCLIIPINRISLSFLGESKNKLNSVEQKFCYGSDVYSLYPFLSNLFNIMNNTNIVKSDIETHKKSVSYLSLPSCNLCLRRIKNLSIIKTNDIIITRSYSHSLDPQNVEIMNISYAIVPCLICHTYKEFNVTNSSSSGYNGRNIPINCVECNISENLWMCMICSYTGCGRYTAKHAESHYHNTMQTHNLSLEAASGRIWDYYNDLFVHFEDNVIINATNMVGNNINGRFGYERRDVITDNNNNNNNSNNINDQSNVSLMKSPIVMKNNNGSEMMSPAADDVLDVYSIQKMSTLMSDYDSLLKSQLIDQQIYYEKLLARETVRALELSYQGSHHSNVESKIGKQLKSEDGDVNIDSVNMQEIEDLKIQISAVEKDYKDVLDYISVTESETRKMKNVNDNLIKLIKQENEKETDLVMKREILHNQHLEKIKELEMQITDLNFYSSTQRKLETSVYREEIINGTVVTKQTSTTPNSNNKKSNNTRKTK